MAGYIRQSSFSDGDTITAALFNNEYNQLLNAFSNTSGHAHDGTTAEGPVIGLIGDAGETSPNNKVLIDTSNNYIEFYVEVSSSSVQQLYIADGAIVPVTDNDIDLGTSSLEFKDGYFDGTLYADAINFNGTAITATAAELNILDGVTSTAAELNILDGVTSTAAELNILDGVTSTATELNIVDGSTSATSTTLADADRVVVNDNGTMVQVALTDFETYFESALDTLSNVTTVGALNSGSITSGFGSIDNGSSAITTTGTITYGSLSDGTITITAFADEDDMSSNSATLVPTQQSVKAYVDSQVTAQDLDLTTDSGTIAIDLDSETLTIGGTSNEIETSATGNAVTIGIPAAAQITTSLGVGGGSTNGVQISQGAIAIKNGGTQSYIDFYCESSNAHYARLQSAAHSAYSGNITLTLPASTGTLALTSDDITGTAAVATSVTVSANNSTDETIFPVFVDGATGSQGLETDTGFTYNPSSGNLTIGGELSAATLDISGNVDVDGTLEADAITVNGTTLAETISDTVGAMVSSNTETGISVTYDDSDNTLDFVIGSDVIVNSMIADDAIDSAQIADGSIDTAHIADDQVTGDKLSNDVTIANDLTVSGNLVVTGTTTQTGATVSNSNFQALSNNNSGNATDFGFYGKYVESSTTKYAGLFFDASTDNTFRLFVDTQTAPSTTVNTSATGYAAGTLVANVTGDVTGNVSGTAATVTGAAQSNITSLGTLTTLTVDNVIINGTTIGHTSDTDLMTLADGVLTVAGEVDATSLDISGDIDVDGTANLDNTDIDGTLNTSGVVTCQTSANISQVAITSSSNATAWDAAAAANAYYSTSENTTISAPSNAVEGAIISIEIAQGGTARTVAWNTVFEFASSTAPTVTATANKTDIFAFRYNGSVWQEIGRVQNMAQT